MSTRYGVLGFFALLLVIAVTMGCGSSQSTSSTPGQGSPGGSTGPTATTPTETTPTEATPSEPTTTRSEPSGTSSASKLDEICTRVHDEYHTTEPSPSGGADPTTLQVKADHLLADAASEVRAAGAIELADTLDKQVEAGKTLAAAMSEGRFNTESESNALTKAGKNTAAAARAAGATACEQLGGL